MSKVSVQNVSDQERELTVGNINHVLDPGDCVDVPAELAERLLEQPDNWGRSTELTRDELAEQFDGDAAGLSRTELDAALNPGTAEPVGPRTVAEYKAALDELEVEYPPNAKKAELQDLFDNYEPEAESGEGPTDDTDPGVSDPTAGDGAQ